LTHQIQKTFAGEALFFDFFSVLFFLWSFVVKPALMAKEFYSCIRGYWQSHFCLFLGVPHNQVVYDKEMCFSGWWWLRGFCAVPIKIVYHKKEI
jgi:hypothetical protein